MQFPMTETISKNIYIKLFELKGDITNGQLSGKRPLRHCCSISYGFFTNIYNYESDATEQFSRSEEVHGRKVT